MLRNLTETHIEHGQLSQTITNRHRVNVPRALLKQFLEEDVKETAGQVVTKDDYQGTQRDLADGKSTFTTDNKSLVDTLTETGRQELRGFLDVLTDPESNGADGFFTSAGVPSMTKNFEEHITIETTCAKRLE